MIERKLFRTTANVLAISGSLLLANANAVSASENNNSAGSVPMPGNLRVGDSLKGVKIIDFEPRQQAETDSMHVEHTERAELLTIVHSSLLNGTLAPTAKNEGPNLDVGFYISEHAGSVALGAVEYDGVTKKVILATKPSVLKEGVDQLYEAVKQGEGLQVSIDNTSMANHEIAVNSNPFLASGTAGQMT